MKEYKLFEENHYHGNIMCPLSKLSNTKMGYKRWPCVKNLPRPDPAFAMSSQPFPFFSCDTLSILKLRFLFIFPELVTYVKSDEECILINKSIQSFRISYNKPGISLNHTVHTAALLNNERVVLKTPKGPVFLFQFPVTTKSKHQCYDVVIGYRKTPTGVSILLHLVMLIPRRIGG